MYILISDSNNNRQIFLVDKINGYNSYNQQKLNVVLRWMTTNRHINGPIYAEFNFISTNSDSNSPKQLIAK